MADGVSVAPPSVEAPSASAQQQDSLGWERLATNLRVERQLVEVLDLLQDLPVVVFKGAVLTRQIYGDLRRRASADNDLWLPPSEATIALGRLTAVGFRPINAIEPEVALERWGQVALVAAQDPDGASVDLHAHPFSRRYFNVDDGLIEQHLTEMSIQGHTVRTFDLPLAWVHLVAHWVQHHFEPRLLPDLAAAWTAFGLSRQSRSLEALAAQTCTVEAMDLALLLAFAEAELPTSHRLAWRVRQIARVLGPTSGSRPEVIRKFLSVYLVAPQRLPQAVLGAALLPKDELESRYGRGLRLALLARHVWRSILC